MVNQVKNMALNEVHANVHEHGEDQPALDSRVARWRSMIVKQSIEGASVDIRGATRLPDETGGTITADEADCTKDEITEKRSRKITETEKLFRLSTLKERKEKINARLQKKSSTMGSFKNDCT